MMSTAASHPQGGKEKNSKAHSTHNSKSNSDRAMSGEGPVAKIQPTAEQIRLAQIIETKSADDTHLQDKIKQVMELTGKTSDDVIVALHDSGSDTTSAINMLLEGDIDQGEWKTSSRKKKPQAAKTTENNGVVGNNKENKSRDSGSGRDGGREMKDRDSSFKNRDRGHPPRMSRGRGSEMTKNERNIEDTNHRERFGDRRGRGGRMMNGRPSGRGRGGGGGPRGRMFQGRPSHPREDGFPRSIDTWNNNTVDNTESTTETLNVGQWNDFPQTEDWDNEDWTESLTETKVFTASSAMGNQGNAVAPLQDATNTNSSIGQSLDLSTLLQKSTDNPDQSGVPMTHVQSTYISQFTQQATDSLKATLGVGSTSNSTVQAGNGGGAFGGMSQNHFSSGGPGFSSSSSFNPSYSSTAAVGQVSGLSSAASPLGKSGFGSMAAGNSGSQSSGVGSSSPLGGGGQSVMNRMSQHSALSSQQSQGSMSQNQSSRPMVQMNVPSGLPPRTKPQKARVPPPSKIPSSAVEMPDDVITNLDVQFGGLEFGTDSSSFDFGANESLSFQQQANSVQQSVPPTNSINSLSSQLSGNMASGLGSSVSNSGFVQQNSKSNVLSTSPLSASNPDSLSARSFVQTANSVSSLNSVQQQQSNLSQVSSTSSLQNTAQKMMTADAMPFVTDRKTTSFVGQRSALDNSLSSNKSDSSSGLGSYSGSGYQSSYQSQKSGSYASHQLSSTTTSNQAHVTPTLSSGQTGGYQASQNQSYSSQNQNQGVSASISSYTNTPASTPSYTAHSLGQQQQQQSYGSGSFTPLSSSQGGYSSQGSYGGSQSGSGSSHNAMASAKLNASLSSVKESGLDNTSSQHVYDSSHTTASSGNLSTVTSSTTSNVSLSAGGTGSGQSVGQSIASSASMVGSSAKPSSVSGGNKSNMTMPPGVQPYQYMIGQTPGMPIYGLHQQVYSYEDLQLLQSRVMPQYYDMAYQQPTSLTSRDAGINNVAYSAGADTKFNRGDSNSSPVPTTLSQQQAPAQHQQQQFLNPAALPPGYGYYYAGGMMAAGSFPQYGTPIFPQQVTPATNAHGHSAGTQYQKATTYGSHGYNSGYETLTQVQDYGKGAYGAGQGKGVSGSGSSLNSIGADMSGAVYSKGHSQLNKQQSFYRSLYGGDYYPKSFDKQGFHAGTPPPFNLQGTGSGPLGAAPSAAYAAPTFIPMMPHHQTHHSAMMHPQLHQDASQGQGPPNLGSAGSQRGVNQSGGQPKGNGPSSKQSYSTGSYWSTN